ncbi:nuclease-related domain-containing protein [Acinetobacter indicus]|uniref:nuclease-related domain-containing protein n=1 Tax=Acinetobacter indicus TaxID=756892 RepID=UPI000948D50A|nr:nuclease-related domain-containing protein [Acinetobacter indicus]QIZ62532.1 NERD domain-containing protein [Acinetobacter indicus]
MHDVNILSMLISQLWWLLLILLGLSLLRVFLPDLKGKIGEWAVLRQAKQHLDERYILLNDLTLPDQDGGTTQIDHVLLSPFGIFVIESKNYKGWIFGSARQKMWTQKIYKKSYKFQNPLHQNYKHTQVLSHLLADLLEPEHLHSLVVFMPGCEFKTEMPKQVFQGAGWVNYVQEFQTEVISAMRLKRLQLRLEKEVLDPSWQTRRAHVAQLKSRHHQD